VRNSQHGLFTIVSHTHLYIRIYRSSHTRRHTHFCNWWQIIILSGGVPWKHVWIPHWKDLIVDVHCNAVLYYNLPTDGWNKDMHACILCVKQCMSAVTFQVTHALIVSLYNAFFFVAMRPSTLETEQPSTKVVATTQQEMAYQVSQNSSCTTL